MTSWMKMTNELGPSIIYHAYEPKTGMKGVVVVDTIRNGIAGGGTRMMPDITTEEIFGLARAMTYKFAALDFPFGGAKAGIWADPGIEGDQRKELFLAFGETVKPLLTGGITLAADIGTHADDVATFYLGAGLPTPGSGLAFEEVDGEPMENLATGFGVVESAKAACEVAKLDMAGATAAIEGFGKVGTGVARYLAEYKTVVAAISTVNGCLYNPDGLDVEKLLALQKEFGDDLIHNYPEAEVIDRTGIYGLPVDILIPGARPYVIDDKNVGQIKAKVISSIANIPITEDAEETLFQKGILTVPDFISNAGGITVGIIDSLGGGVDHVFNALQKILNPLTRDILIEAKEKKVNPRVLAIQKTTAQVLAARENENSPGVEELVDRLKTQLTLK